MNKPKISSTTTLHSTRRGIFILGGIIAALLAVLGGTPFLAAATMTVQTDKSTYTSLEPIMVTGSVSPPPGPGTSIFINMSNPRGIMMDAAAAKVDSATGAFNRTFVAGSNWIDGNYTVQATWAATVYSSPDVAFATFLYLANMTSTTSTTTTSSTTTTTTTPTTTSTTTTTTTTTTTLPRTTTTTKPSEGGGVVGIFSPITTIAIGAVIAAGAGVGVFLLKRRR